MSGFSVVVYQTSAGKKPFEEWLARLRLRDRLTAAMVDARIARIRDQGNFGDHKTVGHPVCELRIHRGPGYRMYYMRQAHGLVILLAGGEKSDQRRDMAKAQAYAADIARRS